MKYKKIRDIIYGSDCDSIVDRSGGTSFVGNKRPLYFILENKRLGLRIWVMKDFGRLTITTAKTGIPLNSRAYSDSHRFYTYKLQRDMARKLEKILADEAKPQDESVAA